MIPENLKYQESHEWVRQEENIAIVGISDYAQSEIQDIVYVETAGDRHRGHTKNRVRGHRVG